MRLHDVAFTIRGLMAMAAVSALVLAPFAWLSPGSRWPLFIGVLTVGSMLLIVASPFLLDWLGGDQELRPVGPRRGAAARRGPGVPASIGVGLLVGLGVTALALAMTGSGHGWGSGLLSSVSIVGAPLAGLTWSQRRRRGGFLLAMAVLLGALGVDLILWRETVSEGTSYLARVWWSEPGLVLTWAVMFASWQVLAVIVVLVRLRDRNAA
jgi:hypothetical protein